MTTGSDGAERRQGRWSDRVRTAAAAAALGVGLAGLGAAPVAALEAISIPPAADEGGDDACPALTRIKYPWSNCGEGFALGFEVGPYGEPPASQCRLFVRDGICAATTEPWNGLYLGIVPKLSPGALSHEL